MKTTISDNPSQDIIEEYAMGEILESNLDTSRQNYNYELKTIRNFSGVSNKRGTILRYAAESLKKDFKEQREKGTQRYDWDAITYKDQNGMLLELVSDRIIEADQLTKELISLKIMDRIEENLYQYFKTEFEEKVEEAKIDYDYYATNYQGN